MKCDDCDSADACGRLVPPDGAYFEDSRYRAVCERCAVNPDYDDCVLIPFPTTEKKDSTK